MKPRYTDLDRYAQPYVRSAESLKTGYLARRFDKLCPGWRRPKPVEQPRVLPMRKVGR